MSNDSTDPPLPPPSTNALVGSVLADRYRIDRVLGEGGMGAVYVGEHLLMHKRVAIKVLHPEMLGNVEVVARFEREAMASAHIDHPNVAAATDFGKLADGSFFLVLELLEGTSVRDLLDREGALGVARSLHVTRQIAGALVRAHGLGIVHRDLKPDNIMLVERDGDPDFVKVLDFGIAKVSMADLAGKSVATSAAANGLTQLGVMYGTPEYMAPEQVLGREIDARADLYALGIMLYEMIAGELPFVSEDRLGVVMMHLSNPPPPICARVPEAGKDTEALILDLLAKEPAQRVQTARELLERIDALGGHPASSRGLPRASVVVHGGGTDTTNATVFAQAATPYATGTVASVRLRPEVPGARAGSAKRQLEEIRAKLPAPFHTLPLEALVAIPLGVAALAFVSLVALLMILFRSPAGPAQSPTGEPVAAQASASEEEIREAKGRGAAGLEELSSRFPDDGRVARALVSALTEEKRRVEAMKQLRGLLDKDHAAADDDAMLRSVRSAADDPDASDAAFELIEGPLGERGTELLYDLQTNAKVGQRASKALARPEVRDRSPAVGVAIAFRSASSCDAKKALLARVREVGDKRVLPAMRSLKAASGCGFLRRSDCWPCMRRGTDFSDALAEVEARADAAATSPAASAP